MFHHQGSPDQKKILLTSNAPAHNQKSPGAVRTGLEHSLIQRAVNEPDLLTPNDVLQLQSMIGNQAVIGLLANRRTSNANSSPEGEVDAPQGVHVADRAPSSLVQRGGKKGKKSKDPISSEDESEPSSEDETPTKKKRKLVVKSEDESESEDEASEPNAKRPASAEAFKQKFQVSGPNQPGMTKVREDVTHRFARAYNSEKDRQIQLLKELSTQLYLAAGEALVEKWKEPEIESMWAGGSVFIATNNDNSATQLQKEIGTDLKKALTTAFGKGFTNKVSKRAKEKFEAWFEDYRMHDKTLAAAQEIFDVISERADEEMTLLDVNDITAKHFADNGMIYIVQGTPPVSWAQKVDPKETVHKDGRHAEMKLVYALVKAGYKSGAVIAGKKRPCFGCFVAMSTFEKDYNITHGEYPGKVWFHTYKNEANIVKDAWEQALKNNDINVTAQDIGKRTTRIKMHQDYASESDSEQESQTTTLDGWISELDTQIDDGEIDSQGEHLIGQLNTNKKKLSKKQKNILETAENMMDED